MIDQVLMPVEVVHPAGEPVTVCSVQLLAEGYHVVICPDPLAVSKPFQGFYPTVQFMD